MHRRINKIGLILLLLLGSLTTCISPLDIEVGGRTGQLVEDGLITDQPIPYLVRLSRTAAYNQSSESVNFGEGGATVTITDDRGSYN